MRQAVLTRLLYRCRRVKACVPFADRSYIVFKNNLLCELLIIDKQIQFNFGAQGISFYIMKRMLRKLIKI